MCISLLTLLTSRWYMKVLPCSLKHCCSDCRYIRVRYHSRTSKSRIFSEWKKFCQVPIKKNPVVRSLDFVTATSPIRHITIQWLRNGMHRVFLKSWRNMSLKWSFTSFFLFTEIICENTKKIQLILVNVWWDIIFGKKKRVRSVKWLIIMGKKICPYKFKKTMTDKHVIANRNFISLLP